MTPIIPLSRVVPDGDVSEDRLVYLIGLDGEEDALDFKLSYDLVAKKDAVECVKILVSMANTHGGYVVLGLEEVNRPTGRYRVVGCPEAHLKGLDITPASDKFERYVEEPLNVRIQIHRPSRYGGVPLPMLFVPRSRTLPLTFKIQGEYQVTEANGAVRNVTAFRPGQIWVRRGGRCILASAQDWRRIRSDVRQLERDKWADDVLGVTALIQRMDRIASLLERLITMSGAVPGIADRERPALTENDYLLPPRHLAERVRELRRTER